MTSDDAMLEATWARWQVEHSGVLDPDQPTEWSHREYVQRVEAELTPQERRRIRYLLRFIEEPTDGDG